MKSLVNKGFCVLLLTAVAFITMVYSSATDVVVVIPSSATTCYIKSCNRHGVEKNYFLCSESVYVMGENLPNKYRGTKVRIYVVRDRDWNSKDIIPKKIPRVARNVLVAENGSILPQEICKSQLCPGKFDIVIDLNRDKIYEVGVDLLDDNNAGGTAGFVVLTRSQCTHVCDPPCRGLPIPRP